MKGLFILLFLCSWSLNLKAQEKPSFPITGTFKLQVDDKNGARDYNKVIIEKDGYSVLKDKQVLRTYKIISKTDEGYRVEQYFTGPGSEKKDKPRFLVHLDKENTTDCFITVTYGNRTEKIHLIRIK